MGCIKKTYPLDRSWKFIWGVESSELCYLGAHAKPLLTSFWEKSKDPGGKKDKITALMIRRGVQIHFINYTKLPCL